MSEQLESNKATFSVEDDTGNHFNVDIQNKYTHDGNGDVSNIKVLSNTYGNKDSFVEIGEFKEGKLVLNDTGLQNFSLSISKFEKESKKITAKPEVIRDLNVETNEKKDNLLEKSGKKNVENADEGINLSDRETITEDNIIGVRSSKGISVSSIKDVINKKTKKSLILGEIINKTDLI